MRRCSHAGPCGCAMAHVSRLVEPVVLFLIARKGQAYGYDLAAELPRYAPAAGADRTALYRCLRQLEANGHLESKWELPAAGPARRVYHVTASGRAHLREWMSVVEQLAGSLELLAAEARTLFNHEPWMEESLSQ